MTETPGDTGTERMAAAREGMPVLDVTGEEIGTVQEMKLGDPEAVTGAGQEAGDNPPTILGHIAEAFTSDDLPEHVAERARRLGYLKVSRTMSPTDIFVIGDQVADVADGSVRLSVERDELYAK
ncbi:hypothetical protein G1H11_18980 [Phytoactinopolyspora alkaliphila]|uniref:Uncharacterized protein n=1 Tax=Phytoactinopolyspora alkaliphila TaxID=1783498 RepID=A0A6N9YR27_9ACTN|nr:hypothetical protein [Phytoactinopolyspora alkaliphila]NED97385.1 hypothetical protein [Phytoactinopolyspora alkaliphila]